MAYDARESSVTRWTAMIFAAVIVGGGWTCAAAAAAVQTPVPRTSAGAPSIPQTTPAPPPRPTPSSSPSPTTSATPTSAPQAPSATGAAFLWILVVLALAAGIPGLLRYVFPGTASSDGRSDVVMAALVGLYALGLFSTPFLGLPGYDWMVLDIVALAVSLGAGGFGFLFGLPQRTPAAAGVSADPDASHLQPSTNLESVAEQLTKYVTGAAFASIAVAVGYIGQFGAWVKVALSPSATAGAVLGSMLLVMYGSLGFVIAYIVTRTILGGAFLQADNQLLRRGSQTLEAVLPDVGDEATDEQRALAAKIVQVSFDSLKTTEQRLTWARAQTIVGAFDKARVAYASLYATNPDDPDIVIGFATALYNDKSFKDFDYAISLAQQAQKAIKPDDAERQARVAALIAAANLYTTVGYVTTIVTVNDFLKTGFTAPPVLHFYRACGFGQLYRAYRDADRLTTDDKAAIKERITADTVITLGFGASYRERIVTTANPPAGSPDDDLQAFAADNADYAKLLGISPPPPPPDKTSKWAPKVVALPDADTPAVLARTSPP